MELGLSEHVLNAIQKLGYKEPSDIQEQIIPMILNHQDVIGQAQTGTGKTLAYAASILSLLKKEAKKVTTIVLVPTRELAMQVSDEFDALNSSHYFKILPVYGGSSITTQVNALRKRVDIVVGTPGRVMDLMRRGALKIDALDYFILDEADEMLNMGFSSDIEEIFKKTNKEKQVLLFSATMPKEILKLAQKYMKKDYEHVIIKSKTKTSSFLKQYYYLVNDKMRKEVLCRIIDAKNLNSAIIFCQTKKEVDNLYTELTKRNYSVEAMHGDIQQSARIETLDRFKKGMFQYLIATDVAARGIHVDNISCVINYNIPQDIESYIHRVGRTGRAKNDGLAITLITPRQEHFIRDVEKKAKCIVEKQEIPEQTEIFESQYQNILSQVEKIMEDKTYEDYFKYVRDMNKEDSLRFSAALLKLTFDRMIGSDFNQSLKVETYQRNMKEDGTIRVFLTIGKLDKLSKRSLLDYICKTTKLDKENFTGIEVLTKFTFINVNAEVLDEFISKINNQKYKGRTIRVEIAKKR